MTITQPDPFIQLSRFNPAPTPSEMEWLAVMAAKFASQAGWKKIDVEPDVVFGDTFEAFRKGSPTDALGHGVRLCHIEDVRNELAMAPLGGIAVLRVSRDRMGDHRQSVVDG